MRPMEEVDETELHDATAGLGSFHQVREQSVYLVNIPECVASLQEILVQLQQDSETTGWKVRLRLGEWKTLSNQLVHLLVYYREELEIVHYTMMVMVLLTTRVGMKGPEQRKHLTHLQDYKEAFSKTNVFIILMNLLMETMEDEENPQEVAEENSKRTKEERAEMHDAVLDLFCNLTSVPDPAAGDAGFTPLRRYLQYEYVRLFHNEHVLDFLALLAESVTENFRTRPGPVQERKAWALADILYHISAHVDPEELLVDRKEKSKRELSELLSRVTTAGTATRKAVRHRHFGTTLALKTPDGGLEIKTSLNNSGSVEKAERLWRKEFHDPTARSDKKRNFFHDPFFVDLTQGSVREHNQLNQHIRAAAVGSRSHPEDVLEGLRKFFEDFVKTSFSSLVAALRVSAGSTKPDAANYTEFRQPRLLNFLSWVLEFHRRHYMSEAARAEKDGEGSKPIINIAAVQGALDLDMIQYTVDRVREYGKDANMHPSLLVMALRVLSQQVQLIGVCIESADSETRDCGEILTQNLIKDDVMSKVSWVMKNFKSSVHDPRTLSYAVEVFSHLLQLMDKVVARQSPDFAFQVNKTFGEKIRRETTNVEKEIAGLADSRVIENLFHLLEKWRSLSSQMNHNLVHLLYKIIRVQATNIVVFFELSYFIRIDRIVTELSDTGGRDGKRYADMIGLLRYIIRQFMKCAETNGCAFVELLFRKVEEKQSKEMLLESHASEFQAILDNYENEDYRRILDRMRAGETLSSMKTRQRAVMGGELAWTEEEDELLRVRYPVFAGHPLAAEYLASELPAENGRTGRQVRKRLLHLGLNTAAVRNAVGRVDEGDAAESDSEAPPAKKRKGEPAPDQSQAADAEAESDGDLEEELGKLLETQNEFEARQAQGQDREEPAADGESEAGDLEQELEKLLESEFDKLMGVPEEEEGAEGAME